MPLSEEFRVELTCIIKTWIAKEQLDWEKIKHYDLKVMSRVVPLSGRLLKYCILCDTTKHITMTALWQYDDRKQNVVYFLCEDCAKEFLDLPEDQRKSIVEKIIEKQIDATPVVKL